MKKIRYLDCDVEEPNGHLFLKPEIQNREDIILFSPMDVNKSKCSACGKCVEVCRYNALALLKDNVLFFKNLCHICGACTIVCPQNAIIERTRKIGELLHGKSGEIDSIIYLKEHFKPKKNLDVLDIDESKPRVEESVVPELCSIIVFSKE